MSNPVRILLVDDHALFRESLVRLLESESDFRVVGHCATIAQASRILSSTPVDVILLDYDLGEEFGTDLLRELNLRESGVRVLMVTAAKLRVSETSIKATIQELFNKAGVRTRSQLVRVAIEKYSTDWLRSER
jgi:DNA-binding NarL/FixJ family response regulator